MEPMTLGSPGGSPAAGNSPYLPSYLMGDAQAPSTPRSNTLSPNKGSRNISFASQCPSSPQDLNRTQKTIFGYQQTPLHQNFSGTQLQSHSTSISGPPTQGLFDSLLADRNQVPTPTRQSIAHNQQSQFCSPNSSYHYSMNQSQVQDSYQSPSTFNASRITSRDFHNSINTSNLLQSPTAQHYAEFWVTVFGFPQSATAMILSHFSQCGTIIDKVFPSQNGNWVHLKFSCRVECDKALNYNEKILGSNVMIGVTECKDKNIVDKENMCDNILPNRIRPLTQIAYKSVQNESAVITSPNAPQKSSGIIDKAMDLFFGW